MEARRDMDVDYFFFFSSRRRHTRCLSDWSSDVCSSDLYDPQVRQLADGGSANGPSRVQRVQRSWRRSVRAERRKSPATPRVTYNLGSSPKSVISARLATAGERSSDRSPQ